jgi:DUF971 family protein
VEQARVPTAITLHQKSGVLEIAFSDGRAFRLPYEFLRVQTGKRSVGILSLEPVGSYAVQPVFSDGHSTGIYSWDYLYELGETQDSRWTKYLAKLDAAGASRDG